MIRKFYDINKSMEFRAFVRDGALIGICQRDCTAVYPFLSQKDEQVTFKNEKIDIPALVV